MERSKLLAAAFLAGAFTLGATVGYGWDRTMTAARGGRSVAMAPSHYDDFAAELQLTGAQRAAVDSILDARHRTIDSLVAPLRPRIARVRDDARREIAARLNAEQRARYDAYLARRRQEGARSRGGSGSAPSGPGGGS